MTKKKAKGANPGFHLADLVALSCWETQEEMGRGAGAGWKPDAERYPKKTDDDEKARGHIIGEIVKVGGVSEASVRSYAACAALGLVQHICAKTIAYGDGDNSPLNVAWVDRHLHWRGSEYGEPKVSEALAQLHREGLTDRLLVYLWENFPDFAKARGLPRPEDVAAAERQTDKPGMDATAADVYDSDAFMAVKEFMDQLAEKQGGVDNNTWTKIKRKNPWIRFDLQAPTSRPRIHRADAAKLLDRLDVNTWELLDEGEHPSIAGEALDEQIADAIATKRAIRETKRRKGG